MRVQLLGRLEVREAEQLVPLEGPRQRTLLALLALHSGMVVSTDRILDEVWGEGPPAHPANTIQAQISRLRALLGSKRIATASGGYRLDVDREDVDIYRFEALVAAGRMAQKSGEPTAAAATLSEALALWHGPALADVLDMDCARAEAGRLDELRLIALESRIEADLAVGRHAEVIPELSALTEAHPLREHFFALLMISLYRAGRQAEALRVFRKARAQLVDELGVDPSEELQRLEQRILIHDAGLLGPASSPVPRQAPAASRATGNLRTPLTSFVGRHDLLDQVRQFIRSWRLVTLTGTGGSGKTRLALEAAGAADLPLPDGVWVVELAPVSEPDRIASAILQALDVRSQPPPTMQAAPAPGTVRPAVERLRQYLQEKQLLLVLDNCEHLVEGVAELAEALLRDCGRLRIVTTGREPLEVPGEMQLPVPPMRYPGPAEQDPEAIARHEAVQLFVERARAVSPGFCLSEGNAVQAGEICRRLDGIPLAIELAAARTKTMSPKEITRDLADRFSLLTGGSRTATARHRTLAAMVDWSYELLSAAERAVFDRLSVFSGGFTVDAAAAVCADLPEMDAAAVRDCVDRLVNKSLVSAEVGTGDRARYEMLETIREYGIARLHATDDYGTVRDKHAAYFLAVGEEGGRRVRGPDQPEWLANLQRETGNLDTALDWLLERGEAEPAQRMAGALAWYWWIRAEHQSGTRRLLAALELDGSETSPTVHTLALAWASHLAQNAHDLDAAVRLGRKALDVGTAAGSSDSDLALASAFLAHALMRQGKHAEAAPHIARAFNGLNEATDHWVLASSYIVAGLGAFWQGDVERATELFTNALTHYRRSGDQWGVLRALFRLGAVNECRGHYREATALADEGLDLARRLGLAEMVAARLADLGRLAILRSDPDTARDLLHESLNTAAWIGAEEPAAGARNSLGILVRAEKDLERASALHTSALESYERMALSREAGLSRICLGLVLVDLGKTAEARECFERAIATGESVHDPWMLAMGAEALARAVCRTDRQRAADLLARARQIRDETGMPTPTWLADDVDRTAKAVESPAPPPPTPNRVTRSPHAPAPPDAAERPR
ncbi:BTAD domain-containing putative transcriptional regulator [Streptomyces coffeae]|uniref:Winged helix-turn-helix domain-containing protein n=1 Tax=Streptomyces coffeae TaxID=621382 RepID=A0ABS1NLQ8_9ACTN|nr:BTAD domain-containing putative transcriptional regulator [Streptomyces coffeae]MBL1101042.1 winged helix-turn-helix domain-containing protein [Streptomyces coffeae]